MLGVLKLRSRSREPPADRLSENVPGFGTYLSGLNSTGPAMREPADT
jgi:hypothetical protein